MKHLSVVDVAGKLTLDPLQVSRSGRFLSCVKSQRVTTTLAVNDTHWAILAVYCSALVNHCSPGNPVLLIRRACLCNSTGILIFSVQCSENSLGRLHGIAEIPVNLFRHSFLRVNLLYNSVIWSDLRWISPERLSLSPPGSVLRQRPGPSLFRIPQWTGSGMSRIILTPPRWSSALTTSGWSPGSPLGLDW